MIVKQYWWSKKSLIAQLLMLWCFKVMKIPKPNPHSNHTAAVAYPWTPVNAVDWKISGKKNTPNQSKPHHVNKTYYQASQMLTWTIQIRWCGSSRANNKFHTYVGPKSFKLKCNRARENGTYRPVMLVSNIIDSIVVLEITQRIWSFDWALLLNRGTKN